ncbi:MAG: BLUF domain-containing protein [Dongiaceae bacterium]
MHQLVYSSKSARLFSQAELEELLAKARKNNGALGLTGLLLYKDGEFIQCLEGERTAIESLMKKIQRDPRHDSIRIMVECEAKARDFGDWSMAFRRIDGSHSASYDGIFGADRPGHEGVPKIMLRLYHRASF